MKRQFSQLSAVCVATSLLLSIRASAFDNDIGTSSHTLPLPLPQQVGQGLPARPDFLVSSGQSDNGGVRVSYALIRDSIGPGTEEIHFAYPTATTVRGLYVCGRDALTEVDGVPRVNVNAPSCHIPSNSPALARKDNELGQPPWGWVSNRLNWNTDTGEHYLITKAAAEKAGLLATRLFEPFWIRYPASNKYVVSRQGDGTIFVGQSLNPTSFASAEVSVTRGVDLLELSMAPDMSHSLSDWAAGDETCPVLGYDGMYTGSVENECHIFTHGLAAVNVTHFYPLNRQVYTYYHHLAKARMSRCGRLVAISHELYDDPFNTRPFISDENTEAHECEREAMAYEMYAQHFLEDNWSSGHMWAAWGYPDPSSYPDRFQSEQSLLIPDRNLAPRRATIAVMTGIMRGLVHGAKSLSVDKIGKIIGETATDALLSRGLLDDPLNGPFILEHVDDFPTRTPVSWLDTNATDRFPGMGDDFWLKRPPSPAPELATDEDYAEQRTRMLGCAAKSMLDVYTSGPMVHGTPATSTIGQVHSVEFSSLDPEGPICWEHLVTNKSMYGATSVVPLMYSPNIILQTIGPVLAQATGFRLSLPSQLTSGINFFTGTPTTVDEQFARDDATDFLTRAADEFIRSWTAVDLSYEHMERDDPFGTLSAKGEAFDLQPLRVFGVPRNSQVVDGEGKPLPPEVPPLYYLDPPGDVPTPMSRIFWRGRLQEMCSEIAADPDQLTRLRDRCKDQLDSEACGACIAAAGKHIPVISPGGSRQFSACSIATDGYNGAAAGLPAEWFNYGQRLDAGTLSQEPEVYAFHWCTGTSGMVTTSQGWGSPLSFNGTANAVLSQNLRTVTCEASVWGKETFRFGTVRLRVATLMDDSRAFGANGYPKIGIYNDEEQIDQLLDNPCSRSTTPWNPASRESYSAATERILLDNINRDTAWDSFSRGTRIVERGEGELRTGDCGPQQVTGVWNVPCSRVAELTGLQLTGSSGSRDPSTGMVYLDVPSDSSGGGCYMVEPVRRLPCPNGTVCAASGACINNGKPPLVMVRDP